MPVDAIKPVMQLYNIHIEVKHNKTSRTNLSCTEIKHHKPCHRNLLTWSDVLWRFKHICELFIKLISFTCFLEGVELK